MNEKFFQLPKEKQQAIINAGFRIFSENTYKKSPMSEIAASANISKSLLFYYFHNKKELYLYLLNKAAELTLKFIKEYGCYDETDFFKIMYHGLKAKIEIIRQYPDMSAFVMKTIYEKDPEVCKEIQSIVADIGSYKKNAELFKFDPDQFVEGLDLKMMYEDMYYACEGYLWEKVQSGNIDVDTMEKEILRLVDFWKKLYLRKE